MSRKLIIIAIIAVLLFASVAILNIGNIGSSFVMANSGKWLLPIVAMAALIDSVNPCAFSVLLLTIAFLFSIGKLRSGILKIGSFYILGILIVYMLIGLGLLQTLHTFNVPHLMAKIGALLLVILGSINIVNEFFPSFPIKLRIPRSAHPKMAELMEKASLPTAFFLGALVGLYEFPCTGGPYLLVLGLLYDQKTYLTGVSYLLFYNLIFVLPLVMILLIASDNILLERVKAWKKSETGNMKIWGGIAMIILGVIIFFL